MIIAGLAAFVLNVSAIRSQESVAMVAVAVTDLSPGVSLEAGMVEFVAIDAENPVVQRLITQAGLASAEGQVLTARVMEGEFVSASVLASQASDSNLRAMTVPVDASHAGGGSLISRGDVVDIISVTEGVARYVVTGAEVLNVPTGETGGLVAANDFFVVLAVDADTALALAESLQADSLEVVLTTGAPSPQRLSLDPEEPIEPAEGVGAG